MQMMKRGSLAVAIALCAVTAFSSAAQANARLGTSSTTPVANGSALSFRSAPGTTAKLAFPNGTKVECSAGFASVGSGTVNNNLITGTSGAGTWSSTGTINSLIFGNSIPATQTTSSACTSTINGFPTCTFNVNTALTIDAQINSASNPDQGVNVRVYKTNTSGPVVATGVCTASGGGTITCVYSSTGPPVLGNAPYDTATPPKAGTLAFTNQPFSKTSGPAQCPTTSAGSPALFTASYNLFTSGGTQVFAYKVSEK